MEARGPKRSPEVAWVTLRSCLKTKKHNYILKSSHPSQGTTFCQAWWYTQKTSKDIRGSKPVWASKTLSLFLVHARAHVQRPKINFGCPSSGAILHFETGSLTKTWDATIRLNWPVSPRNLPVSVSPVLGLCAPNLNFYIDAGVVSGHNSSLHVYLTN